MIGCEIENMSTVYRDDLRRNTFVLVLFSLCGLLVYTPYNRIGIWGIIPLLTVYTILKNSVVVFSVLFFSRECRTLI